MSTPTPEDWADFWADASNSLRKAGVSSSDIRDGGLSGSLALASAGDLQSPRYELIRDAVWAGDDDA